MAIRHKNIDSNYILPGVFSSAANYLADSNRTAASEGNTYYDTTLKYLRTYDGSSWSPAGLSSTSTGGLNNSCSIGSTLTIDGSTNTTGITITGTTVATGALLFLNNDDATNDPVALNIDNEANASTAVSIQIDGVAGYDIQGTGDVWHVDYAGDTLLHDLWLKDDLGVQFGSASSKAGDVSVIFHDGAVATAGNGLLFDAVGADEQIQIGDASYSFDVWFVGETATTNKMLWDIDGGENSVGELVFDNADIQLGDNDQIRLGDSQDFTIDYNSADLLIVPAADNDGIIFGASGTGVTITTYSTTANRYMKFDSNRERLVFFSDASSNDPTIQLDDYLTICFGEGSSFGTTGTGDAQLGFDGTNLELLATAADTPFHIGGTAAGFDTTYYYKTAGTITFDWDGPADGNAAGVIIEGGADTMAIQIMDDDYLLFGDSATHGGTTDATMRWDNTNSVLEIVGATLFEDDVTIGTATSDEENLTVYGNITCSGTLSHTGAYLPSAITLTDNEKLKFGTDLDFVLDFDSSTGHLWLEALSADTEFSLGEATNFDLKICCATATDYFLFDTDDSASRLDFVDTAMRFSDGTDIITFGPMASNVFPIESNTEDGHTIKLGSTNAIDLQIFGATNTNYILFNVDDSALDIDLDGFDIIFRDASSSVTIGPCASNVLPFNGGAANDTISFGTTTKVDLLVEGAANDMQWDASRNHLLFHDSAKLAFGGSASSTADYTLSTAGSTAALILVAGTADDAFQIGDGTTGTDIKWVCSGDTNAYVLFDASADTNKGLVSIGVDDYGVDLTLFGATAGEAVAWDQSADALTHVDGTATFSWTMESNSLQLTGDTDGRVLTLGSANEMDIKWAAGDANTNTFVLFDASDDTGVGLVQFGQDDYGVDVKFHGATAGEMVHWDQSADALIHSDGTTTFSWTIESSALRLTPSADNKVVEIGSGTIMTDIKWWAGDADTDGFIFFDASGDTSVGLLEIGQDDHGIDVKFYGDTAGEYVQWDQSADALIHGDGTATFSWTMETNELQLTGDTDGRVLVLGSGNEMDVKWAAGDANTNTFVLFDASDDTGVGLVQFGQDDYGVDVKFHGATAGEMVHWDQSADALIHSDGTTTFSWTIESSALRLTPSADNKVVEIGSGTIMTDIKWWAGDADTDGFVFFDASGDTSVGLVEFGQDDHGIDVIFYGATTAYAIQWDQSTNSLLVKDNTTIDIGNTTASPDQEITPDGTNVDWKINSGILTIGDGGTTNFLEIKADGEINLNGTAKVTKNIQLPIQTGGGTVTVSAITGSPSIDFNADGEIVYLSFQVPNDWDAASDLTFKAMIQNEIAETDGDDIEIIWTVHGIVDGELNADLGQTVTHALNLTGGDEAINIVNQVSAAIDYNHGTYPIGAGDSVMMKGIVSLAAGTECTGPLHIIDSWIEYTASKLGTAT